MLGMDMPAPDYFPFDFHKELLTNGIFLLENLTNLQELLGVNDFEVIALPLKIAAEASFVRAVCRIME
jgi:kynurenine formamidase